MRLSGILLHISSLPGPDGIGSLGREAHRFADFLRMAGMRIWQVLPVSPTGYGESPYQSFSTYAGNPLLIDLEALREEGLLRGAADGESAESVDYTAVMAAKERALRSAYAAGRERYRDELAAFLAAESAWLDDYALFYALKKHFGGGSWMDWPVEALRMRQPAAMAEYRGKLAEDIGYQVFVQYLFFRQWRQLKAYANSQGIQLFGDMPIYVAMDSADCWANPGIFQLDRERRPLWVAGVPPDYFSADGQLWGNPLYDWKALKKSGYRWWLDRLRAMGRLYDMVRVDHFIGFANYYAVRPGAGTARHGVWRKGPGRAFFQAVRRDIRGLTIIAEDLGAVNARVKKLLRFCGYPGMKVLSFAFSGGSGNPHLPEHVKPNCVYYTGTHDNNTLAGWWQTADKQEKQAARRRLDIQSDAQAPARMIEAVLGSAAHRAILPMQDILALGGGARMNTPGTLGGNWRWRMAPGAADAALAGRLKDLNEAYGREQ